MDRVGRKEKKGIEGQASWLSGQGDDSESNRGFSDDHSAVWPLTMR